MISSKQLLISVFLINLTIQQHDLYNTMTSHVHKLIQGNWMNKLQKSIQNDKIFIVHFHEAEDG